MIDNNSPEINKKIDPKDKIKKVALVIGLIAAVLFLVIFLTIQYSPFWKNSAVSPAPTSVDTTATTTATNSETNASTTAPTTVAVSPTATAIPTNVAVAVSQSQNIGHVVGFTAGGNLSKISATDLNQQLDQMVTLGVKWVRFDIEWGLVQYGSPDKSNWTSYDNLINALNAHHLNGLGIIEFTPEWARDSKCYGGAKCPPKDPAVYAKFAAEVVSRYKDKGIHAWEIWNEPNSYDFWATQVDCNAYTALLKATYPAIKNVDPTATIVTGGLAPRGTDAKNLSRLDFLKCIYAAGGKNYFDAVGDHPYTFPTLPSSSDANNWGQMSKTNPSLRSIMIANGDANKKIWMTEYGAPTNGPDPHWYVSEQVQAAIVTDAMNLYKSYSWAGPIFWYTNKDNGPSTSTNENFFGLVRFDGTLKPAYNVLKDIISKGF